MSLPIGACEKHCEGRLSLLAEGVASFVYAARAKAAWLLRGAKVKALPLLAFVFFAPDLRGERTSACNPRSACPVEADHPLIGCIIAQFRAGSKVGGGEGVTRGGGDKVTR